MNDEQASVDTIKFPTPAKKQRQRHHVTSRHYFLAENGAMRYMERDTLESAWLGKKPWPGPDGNVRILSAVFDETENLVGCFFMLVSVVDGKITPESIDQAHAAAMQQALATATSTGQVLPGYLRQASDWPRDWIRQVAAALDVNSEDVHDMGAGGPLVIAATSNYSISDAARLEANSLREKLARGHVKS